MAKHQLIGQKAPEFTTLNSDNEEFHFKPETDDKKPTALFFYPQSGTYGCTREACQFNDAIREEEIFKSTNVRVIGISPDPVLKQKKFVDRNRLTYPILSDEKGEVRKAYHVPRGLMGLTTSSRVTFVIDGEGIVRGVLDTTLNFAAHHKFVQNWLAEQVKQKKSNSQSNDEKYVDGEGTSGLNDTGFSETNPHLGNDGNQAVENEQPAKSANSQADTSNVTSDGTTEETETNESTETTTNLLPGQSGA